MFVVLVVLFIWAYFREWRMSVAAMVALAHDLVITVGVYALTGFEVTPATVTGLLTILGYSLYDTVVVFDKVRENTRGIATSTRRTYADAANLAVNQTLVRSINTSLAALLPVGAILYVGTFQLGSGPLKDLALALFVGMASGTYSSIFIATPLLAQLKMREPAMVTRRSGWRAGAPSRLRLRLGEPEPVDRGYRPARQTGSPDGAAAADDGDEDEVVPAAAVTRRPPRVRSTPAGPSADEQYGGQAGPAAAPGPQQTRQALMAPDGAGQAAARLDLPDPRRPRLPAAGRDVQGHLTPARRPRGLRRRGRGTRGGGAGRSRARRGHKVAGIEARGFILGAPVALSLGVGFVPVRKAGKLPGAIFSQTYALEYGEATLEMHQDAFGPGDRVLVIDDVLATGGTIQATAELIARSGAKVEAVAVLIELSFLHGRERLAGLPFLALTTV